MDNKEKEEVKANDVKKEAKPKKEKKKMINFNEIDVTTATEDDIIQSGIRNNTTGDKICYFLIFVVIILMLLPVALRIFMPKEITEMEKEIVYLDLTCYKTVPINDDVSISTSVAINYRDGYANFVTLNFSYQTNGSEETER